MIKALVLMKALPPTKGHERLIEFARRMADSVTVLIDTAPDEPMLVHRLNALETFNIDLRHIVVDDDELDWHAWEKRLSRYKGYDYVIGSESYCFKVAEIIGARYIPYDPDRELLSVRATDIRNDPEKNFASIAASFQPYLRFNITVFGAESCGKTTLSKNLHDILDSWWLFEWARPYLETVGTDINVQSMTDIWHGQRAIESQARSWTDRPYLIKDTDLFSTVGYWMQPHWTKELGQPPQPLTNDAYRLKSDLYLLCQSNIPFEQDPLRYGGDRRESPDEFWVDIAYRFGLNCYIVQSDDPQGRIEEVLPVIRQEAAKKFGQIAYTRKDW